MPTGASSTPDASYAGSSADDRWDANSWRELIDAGCLAFFDGCNQCRRSPGADVAACTRRACLRYEKPYCLDDGAEGRDPSSQ